MPDAPAQGWWDELGLFHPVPTHAMPQLYAEMEQQYVDNFWHQAPGALDHSSVAPLDYSYQPGALGLSDVHHTATAAGWGVLEHTQMGGGFDNLGTQLLEDVGMPHTPSILPPTPLDTAMGAEWGTGSASVYGNGGGGAQSWSERLGRLQRDHPLEQPAVRARPPAKLSKDKEKKKNSKAGAYKAPFPPQQMMMPVAATYTSQQGVVQVLGAGTHAAALLDATGTSRGGSSKGKGEVNTKHDAGVDSKAQKSKGEDETPRNKGTASDRETLSNTETWSNKAQKSKGEEETPSNKAKPTKNRTKLPKPKETAAQVPKFSTALQSAARNYTTLPSSGAGSQATAQVHVAQGKGFDNVPRHPLQPEKQGKSKELTAKELLVASRDAAETNDADRMCDLVWNASMLPESGRVEAARMMRERPLTKSIRKVLATLVRCSGKTKLAVELLRNLCDDGSSPIPHLEEQQMEELSEFFNQTFPNLWMAPHVFEASHNSSLANDIETGLIFQTPHDVQMMVLLARALSASPYAHHNCTSSAHLNKSTHRVPGSGDSANASDHVIRDLHHPGAFQKTNESFVRLVHGLCNASGIMAEQVLMAYLAKIRVRARNTSTHGLAHDMMRVFLCNLEAVQGVLAEAEHQVPHNLTAAAYDWHSKTNSQHLRENPKRFEDMLVVIADLLCHALTHGGRLREADALLQQAHDFDAHNANTAAAYAQFALRFRNDAQQALDILSASLTDNAGHRGLVSVFAELSRFNSHSHHSTTNTLPDTDKFNSSRRCSNRAAAASAADRMPDILVNAVAAASSSEDRVFCMALSAKMLNLSDKEREQLYRRALTLLPKDLESLKGFGQLLLRRGAFFEAIDVMKLAHKLHPSDVHATACLATALVRSGQDLHQGVPLLANVLALGFQTAETLSAYAYCLQVGYGLTADDKDNEMQRAADIYSKVLQHVPDDAFAIQQYAAMLWRHFDKPDEAEALLRAALEVEPTCASSRTMLGTMLHRINKDFAEAQQEYERALHDSQIVYFSIPPFVFQRYCHFLLSCAEEHQVTRAQELYEQGLELHPSNAGLLTDSARCHYLVKDNHGEARRLLEVAYALHPHHSSVALAFAQFCDAVDGAGPGSAQLYQRAFTLNPLDATAAAGLALHLHHFSTEKHRTHLTYEQALRLNPVDTNVLTNFALFKEEVQGDFAAARSMLERALQLDPSDTECRTYYAQLLHE